MLEIDFRLAWDYKGQRGTETLFHTAIGNLQTDMKDWSPAFKAIKTDVLEPAIIEQFETRGHGKWAPLEESTIKEKGIDLMLMRTGHMFQSFFESGRGHVEDIGPQKMRWGSTIPHTLFHQTGTLSGFQRERKGPGRGMPMRKVLVLDDQKKRMMRSILTRHLATLARRQGFAVASKEGIEVGPLEARQIGKKLLGV